MPGTPEVNHTATAVIHLFQESALHSAAQNGDLKWLKFLVDEKSDINLKDENGVSKRHWLFRIADVRAPLAYVCTFLPPSEDSTACGSRRGLF